MDQENPTGETSDASPLERLEQFISADDAPQPADEEVIEQAADPEVTETEEADEQEQKSEIPEYQLTDVAKLLGADESALDVDDDGNVLVRTKIDGQDGTAKFADLLKSYQLQGHVDKQVREVAEQRKAMQEQAATFQRQMAEQYAVVDKIAEVKSIEASIAQYASIDWDALTDGDPVQAMKYDRHLRDLKQQHADKVAGIRQHQSNFQQQQQQQHQATLELERQALLAALPEWNDVTKAVAEKALIAADLKARGFSDSAISQLSDHKALLMARDAMLYRQQQAVKGTVEKQVRAAPRIVRPGASRPANSQADSLKALRSDVKKSSGSRQSVVDYLLKTGKV